MVKQVAKTVSFPSVKKPLHKFQVVDGHPIDSACWCHWISDKVVKDTFMDSTVEPQFSSTRSNLKLADQIIDLMLLCQM